MTKKKFLVILIFATIFNSCKKDKPFQSKPSIVGRWYWVEQTYYGYTDGQLSYYQDYTTFPSWAYFEYRSDGTFIENTMDHDGVMYYGKYEINDNILHVTEDENHQYTYTIKTLTDHQLIISLGTIDGPTGGGYKYILKR